MTTKTIIELCLEQDEWQQAVDNIENLLTGCLLALYQVLPKAPRTTISVLLTDDAKMKALNTTYRNQRKPTNVLSFRALDVVGAPLGDIALGFETCQREANERGICLSDHLCHLFIHGALHLCGFHHQDNKSAKQMEALESKILIIAEHNDPWQSETK